MRCCPLRPQRRSRGAPATHDGQEDAADVGQGVTADDVHVYANQ